MRVILRGKKQLCLELVDVRSRENMSALRLTSIGQYGVLEKKKKKKKKKEKSKKEKKKRKKKTKKCVDYTVIILQVKNSF